MMIGSPNVTLFSAIIDAPSDPDISLSTIAILPTATSEVATSIPFPGVAFSWQKSYIRR